MPPERRSFSIEMYPGSLDEFEFAMGNAWAAAEGMIP
jgi:hypothetical protein